MATVDVGLKAFFDNLKPGDILELHCYGKWVTAKCSEVHENGILLTVYPAVVDNIFWVSKNKNIVAPLGTYTNKK